MRINIALAIGVGVSGLILAGANLPVDTQITHRTQLGDRTQPYWLVPQQSKMIKVRGGLGIVRLFGAIAGTTGFALAMHFAGEDEREQQKFWFRQSALDAVSQKTEQTFAEIDASTELNKKQMEAQAEVDLFSLRLQQNFRDAIGYVPENYEQLALTHGKPGTLDEFTNPGDKVQEQEVGAIEGEKIPGLTNYPSVLIYGVPGSGKTTFAEEEVKRRQSEGHQVIVLDPHQAYGSWKECEVIGGGMNYEAIDTRLGWFAAEVAKRYKRIQAEANPQFQPITLVCDEFTNWAGRCQNSTEFFRTAVTDIRKAKMLVLIVSHTRTLTGLADAKGMASLRDEALLEIETLGQKDKTTGLAVPRFEVLVKLPGCSLRDRFSVKISQHSITPTAPTAPSTAPDRTESAQSPAPLLDKALNDSHQPHNPIPQGWIMADPANITALVRGTIVACIRAGWTQTRTIQEVFGIARSGSNPSYDLAREIFREISESIGG